MFKTLVPLVLILCSCSAEVVESPQEAPVEVVPTACPVMACGWTDNAETQTESCSAPFAFGSTKQFEMMDDGASACWFYYSVCVTPGPAECIPQACRRVHVTCQPVGDARTGRP